MTGVAQDFRFAYRQLQKSPGFTIIAVLTLALGIGANTAIFSVVNGVLLRPLAFRNPGRLVRVWHVPPAKEFPGMTTFSVSPANYLDWLNQNHVFDDMAIYGGREFTLTGNQAPEQVFAGAVSSSFFTILGVKPLLGRVFLPEEDQPGRNNVVVLSYHFWRDHFGSNTQIVGQSISFDGGKYLVAGVMPAVVVPLHADLVSDVRPALLLLMGAVAFVLLIACVNVANLALAKTFSRQKEIAIRTALGASSARVLRQILTESVTLALAGGAIGLSCAHVGVRLIMPFLASNLPQQVEVHLDPLVLAFTALISVLTGIAAGLLPAMRLSRANASHALKERTLSDSSGHRTRSLLVVAEVALSLVLLFGAGLMIRSFYQLERVNPGFEPHNVLTMTVAVSSKKFASPEQEISFFERVLQPIRTLPGVESAGAIDDIPLGTDRSHQPIAIEGRPALAMSEQPEVDVCLVTAGYMRSLHIPILRCRDFNQDDVAGRPASIIISNSMAREFWPGEDPIGKRLTMTFFPEAVRTIVGVGGVKMDALNQTRSAAVLYMPLGQVSVPVDGTWRSFPMTLVVRTAGDAGSLVAPVSNSVHEVDREIPVRDISTMDDVVANSITPQQLNMMLLAVFGGLAMLLAAIGIYSVLSYSVKRRIPEIGVRLALGATLRDVIRIVVIEGMQPTFLGVGIGIVAALALSQLFSNLIFDVKPTDPLTLVGVTALLSGIALLACVVPAYRATKVDPMVALRYE